MGQWAGSRTRDRPATVGRRIIDAQADQAVDSTTARTILLIARPATQDELERQGRSGRRAVHWYTARTGSATLAQLAVDLAAVLDERPPKLKDTCHSSCARARAAHQ